jgi:uncharacterized protein (DUF1499 family)
VRRANRRGLLIGAAGVAVLLGLVGGLSAASPFGLWQTLGRLAGTRQDLGPVDLPGLTRRATNNDSLVCMPDDCPQARADVTPPVFTIPAARLRDKLLAGLREEAGLTRLPDVSDLHLRFVQHSHFLRLPDLVDVVVLPRSSGAATLALYSRSGLGGPDLGVNRDRVERWLEYIGR